MEYVDRLSLRAAELEHDLHRNEASARWITTRRPAALADIEIDRDGTARPLTLRGAALLARSSDPLHHHRGVHVTPEGWEMPKTTACLIDHEPRG